MANPFPGMDPYLESPLFWSTVHTSLIHAIWLEVKRQLPAGYRASIEERVYIVEPTQHYHPDVAVIETPFIRSTAISPAPNTQLVDAPEIEWMEEVTERHIGIWYGRDQGRLVTSIELLSPGNKSGGTGRDEYTTKQQQLLRSDTHLLEIDLLRGGQPTVAARGTAMRHRGEYIVCLHRASSTRFEVWPFSIRSRMPRVAVPLNAEHDDISLDLGKMFGVMYDAAAFDRDIDYTTDPTPPLSAADAVWMDELLRTAGKRA